MTTFQGRGSGDRSCTLCGVPLRDPANIADDLCHEHNPQRTAAHVAQQRRRRYGTTAPPVRLPLVQAHWLHDAMTAVTVAENAVRARPNTETVLALLAALDRLRRELDPALAETAAVLDAYPCGTPRRPR